MTRRLLFVRPAGIASLLMISVGIAVGADEPKKKNPPVAQPAPAPSAAPAAPVRSPLPDLLAVVPESGPVGRADLIQMALRANPRVWRYRSEMAFHKEAERAAYDWEDPELRLGYNHEFGLDDERPFTERRFVQSSESSLETRRQTGTRTDMDASRTLTGPFSDSRNTTTRGRTTEEIVRRIYPGQYRDVIKERRYVLESSRNRETRHQQDNDGSLQSERSNEDRRRRLISETREIREHPNSLYPDHSYDITLRFFVPNPMRMGAAAAKARAERGLAEAQMRTEIRDVAGDVNERFDELQFWHFWNIQDNKLVDLQKRSLTATEELEKTLGQVQIPGIGSLFDPAEVPRARLEIVKAEEEVFDSRRRMNEVRAELAQLAGLADPSRITIGNRLTLRRLDLRSIDLPALVDLARANRPEMAELLARGNVARAELRDVKARRIPWFNDVRVGVGTQTSDGYREQYDFRALLTLNFPLFSWWQNKAHRMHEEAIKGYEEARLGLTYSLEGQVAYALQLLRDVSVQLDSHDAHRRRLEEVVKQNEADAVAAGDKAARIRLATEEEVIKAERGRLQWVHAYRQAINQLEAAIGTSLEEAFGEPRPAK
jgi:Outer membrane efflux protein